MGFVDGSEVLPENPNVQVCAEFEKKSQKAFSNIALVISTPQLSVHKEADPGSQGVIFVVNLVISTVIVQKGRSKAPVIQNTRQRLLKKNITLQKITHQSLNCWTVWRHLLHQ